MIAAIFRYSEMATINDKQFKECFLSIVATHIIYISAEICQEFPNIFLFIYLSTKWI